MSDLSLPPPLVCVVIPCHQKASTIKRAIDSVKSQTINNLSCIIVDDSSSDNSSEIILTEIASDKRFRYERVEFGNVSPTRNYGISLTDAPFVCTLDGDDFIEPTFLEVCVNALEQDRSLGIAYTGLMTHNPDGTSQPSEWPHKFNPDAQLTYTFKQNQVPTCCVFRRDAWQRVGGYKSRYAPYGAGSEDAAFWSAICSIGFNAKQVTTEPLFNYSMGQGNASGNPDYQEIDWLSMYPWAKDGKHPFASWATPKKYSHAVSQYDDPAISVIIPVGPGHELEAQNALDSLEMQHFRKWEAIVVSDVFDKADPHGWIDRLKVAYPYVRDCFTGGGKGAGFARNWGASVARAPLLFFLDADDVLADAHALDKFIQAWNANEGIIYSDYLGKAIWDYEAAEKEFGDKLVGYNHKKGTAVFKAQSADFDPNLAQRQPELDPSNPNMPYYHWCLVSCLIPKVWHNAIGGFDETMATWEDVDYFWRMARAGHCFYRVPEHLIMYAYHKGQRREKSAVTDEASLQAHKDMIQYIKLKYEGLETVGCNCGAKRQQQTVTGQMAAGSNDADFVMIEFDFSGSAMRDNYGQKLSSPTRQTDPANPNKVLEYKGYSRRKGDRFLVHRLDQQARPDLFRLIPNEVKTPDTPKVELSEPTLLVPEKRRGRPAKVPA
jgi:glycosyltransferase involved in cell wall biosynthesis